MTFALKEFEDLRNKFNDTVTVLLGRELKNITNPDERKRIENLPEHARIEQLSEPRKYEIQYLKAVLTELELQVRNKTKTSKQCSQVFYAAMFIIHKDIKDHLGRFQSAEGSHLHTSLTDIMGINDKNTPEPRQLTECYKSLNKFLSPIFIENDSRKGLKIEHHLLQNVPFEHLVSLLKKGYKLDKEANILSGNTFRAEGKSSVEPTYRPERELPEQTITQLTSWDELKKGLHNLILEERTDKNVSSISHIPNKVRQAQIQSLEIIEAALSKSQPSLKNSEKIAVLAGAMYIVRGQIAQEYKKEPLSNSKALENSIIHTGLTKILKAKDAKFEDIEALIQSTNQYVLHMTVEFAGSSKEIQKDAIRTNNIFSKAEEFKLIPFLALAQDIINICRDGALDVCVEAIKPKVNAPSIWSWWKKPASTKEEDADVEDEKVEALNNNPSVVKI